MNPPIITTTAATPQDSPITTLEHGVSLSDWDNNVQHAQSSCSFLKPPSAVGSIKALNNLLLPEPFPCKKKSESSSRSASIDIEPKASISNIKIDRKDSREMRSASIDTNDGKSSKTKQNVKKRTSGKRKEKTRSSSEAEVLNNGRIDSIGSIDASQKTTKRIQNDTKSTNKTILQSKQSIDANDLPFYNNNNSAAMYYQYDPKQPTLVQHSSHPPPPPHHHHHRGSIARRRMSTKDPQAFQKFARLEIEQLEMLRARALRRQSKQIDEKAAKPQTPEPVTSPLREPIKFTATALRKRFEQFTEGREMYSMYVFAEDNKFRLACDWFVTQKWFDNVILLFIALNCITLAMERPNIPPNCAERYFLSTANYVFTFVFTLEMFVKVKIN